MLELGIGRIRSQRDSCAGNWLVIVVVYHPLQLSRSAWGGIFFSRIFNVCETCIGWIPPKWANPTCVTGSPERPNQATGASVRNCR